MIDEASKMSDNAPGIGTIVEEIIELLIVKGLAWRGIRLLPSQVCVHRCNRYGFGVMVKRVHKLGKQILKIGFVWEACSMGICIREPADKTNAAFTVKLQKKSDGPSFII